MKTAIHPDIAYRALLAFLENGTTASFLPTDLQSLKLVTQKELDHLWESDEYNTDIAYIDMKSWLGLFALAWIGEL